MMNAIDVLKERLKLNYFTFKAKWNEISKDELIKRAYEIYAIQSVYRTLPDLVSVEDAEALLKYENPLHVVAEIYTMGGDTETKSEFEIDYPRTIDVIKCFTDEEIAEFEFAVA